MDFLNLLQLFACRTVTRMGRISVIQGEEPAVLVDSSKGVASHIPPAGFSILMPFLALISVPVFKSE